MVGTQQAHETANATFELLAHHRRRYALQSLRESETPITLAELADEVAVREYDAPVAELSEETVRRVHLSLYHTHVPKLANAEYVQYSRGRDAVSLGDHSARLEQLRAYLRANRSATA